MTASRYTRTQVLEAWPELPEALKQEEERERKQQEAIERLRDGAANIDGDHVRRYALAALVNECDKVTATKGGARNSTLNKAAFALGQLIGAGALDRLQVESALEAAADACGLSGREVPNTIRSGLEAGIEKPRVIPEPKQKSARVTKKRARGMSTSTRQKEPAKEPGAASIDMSKIDAPAHRNTHYSNAYRLTEHHGHELRFVPGEGWLWFNGRYWQRTEARARQRGAKLAAYIIEEAAEVLKEAAQALKNNQKEEAAKLEAEADSLMRWARTSEQTNTIKDSLKQAEFMLELEASELDRHAHLLSVENGTLDLETGILHPHRADHFMTRCAPVAYDPEANAPTFHAFLDEIMGGSAALKTYLQMVTGYTLSGYTLEQCLFFLYGAGANGKSTYLNILIDLLGADYGRRAAPELLMVAGANDRHPTELADLRGARAVFCSETEEGRRFAIQRIKEITGEPTLTARRMRQDPMTFPITFKLFLAANHRPQVNDSTYSFWRRMKIIPFTFTVPKEKQDAHLPEKLRAELPGVLNWALEGYRLWRAKGLGEPAEVRQAVEGYQQQMDTVGGFLEELCEVGPDYRARAGELYAAYEAWCSSQTREALSGGNFKARLLEKGYAVKRAAIGNVWEGLKLYVPAIPGTPKSVGVYDDVGKSGINSSNSLAREGNTGKAYTPLHPYTLEGLTPAAAGVVKRWEAGTLPTTPIDLQPGTRVSDPGAYVASTLEEVRNPNLRQRGIERLEAFARVLQEAQS
jgi:putative DNA primase/helicase